MSLTFFGCKCDPVQDSTDPAIIWYRASEVCRILEFTNASKAVQAHCKKRIRVIKIGPGRAANYIQRSDVIRLGFASKAERAELFRDWIVDEVLPQIFDNGAYISPGITEEQAIDIKAKIERILIAHDPWTRIVDRAVINQIHKFFGAQCSESFWWAYIYDWLTPDERSQLDAANPVNPRTRQRKDRIHQWITSEQSIKARLKDRVRDVGVILQSSTSKTDFQTRISRLEGRDQLSVF